MKARILTALGFVVFGLPLLIFSEYIIYPIGAGALALLSTWEMLRCIGLHKKYAVSIPAYIISLFLPLFAYKGFFPEGEQGKYIMIMALTVFAYLMYLAFLAVLSRGKLSFKEISIAFVGVTYVAVNFTSLALVRYMPNGVFFFELVFIGAWVSDIFAYFTGMLFGKHKLIPELSPKKTVEGAIGGVVFASLAFLLYGFIIESFFSLDANYLVLGISGLLIAVVGQIGDLFASLIKREFGVKDYSNILPGHGGILDRFDSVLSVCTVVMVVCLLFPPFA